jgi:hypothetical protein
MSFSTFTNSIYKYSKITIKQFIYFWMLHFIIKIILFFIIIKMSFTMLNPTVARTIVNPQIVRNYMPLPGYLTN